MKRWLIALLIPLPWLAGAAPVRGQAVPRQPTDPVAALLAQVEHGVLTGNARDYLSLLARDANRAHAIEFCGYELLAGATRAVLLERDRAELQNGELRLIADVFAEYGDRARAATWRLDLESQQNAEGAVEWRIADQEELTSIENVYRLSLNPGVQYDVRNLTIASDRCRIEARGRVGLHRADRPGRDGPRAGGPRQPALPSQARERTAPGRNLLGLSHARRAVRHRLRADEPERFRARMSRRSCLHRIRRTRAT